MSRFSNSKNNFFKPALQKCNSIKAHTIIHKPIEEMDEIIKVVEEIKLEEIKIEEDIKPVEIVEPLNIEIPVNIEIPNEIIPVQEINQIEEVQKEDMTISFNEIYYHVEDKESFSESNPSLKVKKSSKKDLFKLIVDQVILNKKKENINGWII